MLQDLMATQAFLMILHTEKNPDENSDCHMRHNKKISPRKMRREIESVFMKELSV